MNDKKIISRILRLDKEIYNDLLVQDGAFQKSIAIFVSTTILVTMSGFRFISGLLDYLQENLILFQQEFQQEFFFRHYYFIIFFGLLVSRCHGYRISDNLLNTQISFQERANS